MMQERLLERSRRAYELGRLRRGARFGLLAVPPALISVDACSATIASALCGVALALLLVGLAWRGEEYERAIWPGLLAGLAAFSVPLIGTALGLCSAGQPIPMCIAFCVAGGVLAGGFMALKTVERGPPQMAFVLSGIAVAGLLGSLGCAIGGLAGVLGMMLGVAASATPVWIWSVTR